MRVGELVLYSLAKRLYRTEIAHTSEMKASLTDMGAYDAYRHAEGDKVLKALERYGIDIRGRTVVDFGCNDGAVSERYRGAGADVIGVDIDPQAIARARLLHPGVRFEQSFIDRIPLGSASVEVLVSFDVFEHVARPLPILREIYRILKPGSRALICTIGWRMPFAPHLWSVMPVPWAHVLCSERSLLAACRRVYHSPWYVPNMHDLDESGAKKPVKYAHDAIDRSYLNHYLVRDFERDFYRAGFSYRTDVRPIGGLAILRPFTRMPLLRELTGSSVWFVLMK